MTSTQTPNSTLDQFAPLYGIKVGDNDKRSRIFVQSILRGNGAKILSIDETERKQFHATTLQRLTTNLQDGIPEAIANIYKKLLNRKMGLTVVENNNMTQWIEARFENAESISLPSPSIPKSIVSDSKRTLKKVTATLGRSLYGGALNTAKKLVINDEYQKELVRLADGETANKALTFSTPNISRFYINSLYDQIKKEAERVIDNKSTEIKSVERKFTRNYENELVDKNQKKVGIEALEASAGRGETCYGSGLALDSNECKDFMEQCLLGNNVEGCLEFMEKPDYYGRLGDELEKMNIESAAQTLMKYQFKVESIDGVKQFESSDNWSKNLEARLRGEGLAEDRAKASADKIRLNSKLMNFINGVREKVNQEPAVLNPNLSNKELDRASVKYGIPTKKWVPGMNLATLNRLKGLVAATNSRIALVIKALGVNVSPMIGGGDDKPWMDMNDRNMNDYIYLSKDLKNIYNDQKERLQKGGQKVSEADDQLTTSEIEKLRDSELKLYKSNTFKNKYVNLLEQDNGKNPDLLNDKTAKAFMEARNKYFVKTAKRQSNLLDILSSLEQQIEN